MGINIINIYQKIMRSSLAVIALIGAVTQSDVA